MMFVGSWWMSIGWECCVNSTPIATNFSTRLFQADFGRTLDCMSSGFAAAAAEVPRFTSSNSASGLAVLACNGSFSSSTVLPSIDLLFSSSTTNLSVNYVMIVQLVERLYNKHESVRECECLNVSARVFPLTVTGWLELREGLQSHFLSQLTRNHHTCRSADCSRECRGVGRRQTCSEDRGLILEGSIGVVDFVSTHRRCLNMLCRIWLASRYAQRATNNVLHSPICGEITTKSNAHKCATK